MLRFRTVSGAKTQEGRKRFQTELSRCLNYLEIEADRLGMGFRRYRDLAAVAELAGELVHAESVGIATHVDVVPAGKGWKYPAFGGTVAEGQIWGRGAQDDKGPTAMAFSAVDVLQELGLSNLRGIRLLIGTREETSTWPDVDLLKRKNEIPDKVMVPDGTFPVINAEKGMVMLAWDATWKEPQAEPGQPRFILLQNGKRHNMVPDRAELKLGASSSQADAVRRLLAQSRASFEKTVPQADIAISSYKEAKETVFTVKFRGKIAHGAFPQQGHNAALDALRFLGVVARYDSGLDVFARLLTEKCSLLDASGFGIARSHSYFGASTVNLGVIEMTPSRGKAKINVRFPLGLSTSEVSEKFEEIADRASINDLNIESKIEGRAQEPLFVSPEEHPNFLGTLQKAYHTVTGRSADLGAIAGTTYAKAFATAVAFGPLDEKAGEREMAHQVNERVSIKRHLENIRIYALALALLAC